MPCDVTDNQQVDAMVRRVTEEYGRIDVLVNNAGLMVSNGSFLDIDPERWNELMAVNVIGPYLTCRHVVPVMMRQRRGSIINIGSAAGIAPMPGITVYCSGKAALHMFSLCLAEEVREYDIAVNVLDPGLMKSEGSSALPGAQHDWHQRIEPEAVGPSAVCLALQSASTFTGRVASRAEFGVTWP